MVCGGPHLRESWIESDGGVLNFHVRLPVRGDHAMDHLTEEMRDLIRPGDSVRVFELAQNPRDRHLQRDVPPSKRRPWRLSGDGRSYELQAEDGTWTRYSSP
jgi:hypothetical protein